MTTRIVSLILALLFFVSTVGFSIYVIIENNKDDTTNTVEEVTQDEISNTQGEDMLRGTKLEGFEPRTEAVTTLEKIDIIEGTGAEVQPGDSVTVHYTGALVADGTIFESSYDTGSPISFGLEGLIVGWQEGIPGMKVGGKRRLVIPAELAYGARATGTIPANSDLVFDIELLGIAE